MAVFYDWYEHPGSHDKPKEEKILYPRVCFRHRCSTEALCDEIEKMTTAHRADIKLVLSALTDVMSRRLCDGCQVHLEGLGYFSLSLGATEPVYYSTKLKANKVKIGDIKYLPEKSLKKAVMFARAEQMSGKMHSAKLTDEEIDERLTAHFAQQPYLSRIELQSLCHLTQTTANSCLRRLIDEGKLLRKGSTYHPIYVAASGHYGAPAIEEPTTTEET